MEDIPPPPPSSPKVTKQNPKQPPSLELKKQCWDYWIGENIGKTNCLCCQKNPIYQMSFTAGHILAHVNGGPNAKENLRPICQSCNNTMGTKHMDDYMKLNNLQLKSKDQIQDEHHFIKTEELRKIIEGLKFDNDVLKKNNDDYFKKIVEQEIIMSISKSNKENTNTNTISDLNEVSSLKNEIEKLQSQCKEKELDISKFKLELLQLNEKLIQQKSTSTNKIELEDELKKVKNKLNENLEKHMHEKKELQNRINDIIKERDSFKTNINTTEFNYINQIRDLENTNKNLQNEIDSLSNELDELNDEMDKLIKEFNSINKINSNIKPKPKNSNRCKAITNDGNRCPWDSLKSKGEGNSIYCRIHYGGK